MALAASNRPSLVRAQDLSPDQEHQVEEWVAKERRSGALVGRKLLRWYIQRLTQTPDDNLEPGVVDNFLRRHPEIAKMFTPLPQPSPEQAQADKPLTGDNRLRGLAFLKEQRRQDARKALYGDSPPPPRQPAPYPEGEIIYHCHNRYVVRHGDLITKYTISRDGMGSGDHPNEALALRFVKEHTTIPVPDVISSDWDRITMSFVEGQTLQQAWPVLTQDERSAILRDLKEYITQLRAISGNHVGRLDGQGAVVPSILTRSGGPFATQGEFHHWLVRPSKRVNSQSMYWHQITMQLSNDCPIVFTHGDIAARNIMVRNGHIVALLDWEFAGWYPEYWEYVFSLRGLDNIEWETLGEHVPSLFSTRYDLEYILIQFILSLS
ncbi:hypothetical protein CRV24_008903 [Beauveria bassiana]|nr:hypothetical protein CRV24_008903 [Beauveria bassiana]KAH8715125.1 hypothetical protein HC256_003978 [Beauveria bassiana]